MQACLDGAVSHSGAGKSDVREGSSTRGSAFVYGNTSNQIGGSDHLKIFANPDAAETWFKETTLGRRTLEYDVLDMKEGVPTEPTPTWPPRNDFPSLSLHCHESDIFGHRRRLDEQFDAKSSKVSLHCGRSAVGARFQELVAIQAPPCSIFNMAR